MRLSSPLDCARPSQSRCLETTGVCGRVRGCYTGPEYGPLGLCRLAPGTFPFFYITLRIGGGEATEKDVDVPVMGLGKCGLSYLWRRVPCFANINQVKCNKGIFRVLLPMGTGKLCLPLLRVMFSAHSVSRASLS